ncbi:MAG: DUF4399 domain-containing protein [Pseudomonadota bacterium]
MNRSAISLIAAAALTGAALTGGALAGETPSTPGAEVYFVNLVDGDTVTSPVLIQFGLRGMGVAPAGVEKEGTGHHHLIIDEELEGEELDFAVPADDNHRHFGGGQTEATIELAPGTHVLQLVLGDAQHVPHDPPVMSERITVTVK